MLSAAPRPTRRVDDRRSHQRYPIRLTVDYRLLHRGRVDSLGSAQTINVASGGVLIQPDISLPAGRQIELSINWPLLLEGVCPLKLVMWGRITRSDSHGVAIQTRQHEFRTAGIRHSKNTIPDAQARSGKG